MIAALLRRQAFSPSRCRSRQLYETFVLPPTNHLAKGRFQTSVFFQGVNQETFSRAIFAQKRSGLFAPSSRYSATVARLHFARLRKASLGSKTRFSLSRVSMSGMRLRRRGLE